ncbi:FAD-dependent monooxygenase [Cordyceps fumosorosea ARSEF 2679]|uniref:FAD-dependent monooxygenase n=1 Tax=Cordyceps fumosorosea (strain ARSEF 2679) TaxID=1081104 RepID=A0A162KCK9_CORFA|nr:FAD-dependent monooxygenase [Cordyceps fumosorosea ARSEF 2679]OAA66098.1 FAD-dependent monooxygenase [Cordyceps fumosorosea ARSEF 2679]
MTLRVLIIGAGTGGLALAHCLLQSSSTAVPISVTVFERDRTRRDGLQGYRVGISPEGARSLSACIPPSLFSLFRATAAATPDHLNMFTEHLSELLSISGFASPAADGVAAEYSVSRMTLRQLLLTGLEDVVQFDKRFTRYENNADGTVTAHFEDGSSAVGDALVGADGTNSPVRRQYLPHAVVRDSGLRGLGVKVPLTAETRALLTPQMLRGVTMVHAAHGDTAILHVMEFPWDADHGPLPGAVGSSDAHLLAAWPGALFDNTRDYVLLGFGAPRARLPDDVLALPGEAIRELLLERTAAWHPNLRRLFELSDPTTGFALAVRTSERVSPAWASSQVTLIGDAVHTMTPGLGVGANTALLDARILGERLTRAAAGELGVVEAVAGYEAEMHGYAWERVEKSLERFDESDAIYRPGWTGWLAMMGMRAGLRLVNNVPPLKRRMAAQIHRQRGEMEERPEK